MDLREGQRATITLTVLAFLSAGALDARGQELSQPEGIAAGAPFDTESSPTDPTAELTGDAEGDAAEQEDILDMDLDDLVEARVNTLPGDSVLDEVVTSVSRAETSVRRTASAIYVVTPQMIRESGATSVMEALRTVPGVHVARANSGSWAISIRGDSRYFANKLLVQIDGRAIYTPTFGGTLWELHTIPVNDIEAIEVIRGPGSSVWGSNAVNGVINVITRKTADTTGAYAEVGGGDDRRFRTTGRVGGWLGGDVSYRVYGVHLDDDAGTLPGGTPTDGRRAAQAGFRVDWTPTACDTLTLQGDFHGGEKNVVQVPSNDSSANNFLARWTRKIDSTSDLSVQAYYDNYRLSVVESSTLNYHGHDIFDFDTAYHKTAGWHDVVCGFGFRNNETFFNSTPADGTTDPPTDTFDTISYFVQDTITLSEDYAYLTLGSKFEHNDFVGFVYQPAVKLAVSPDQRTGLWASVARAVRTPAVIERDLNVLIPTGPGTFLQSTSSRGLQEEQAITYEIGIRRQATDAFYWDLAAFFSRYDDVNKLVTVTPGTPITVVGSENVGTVDTYGFELWGTYEAAEWWRLRGSFSFFRDFVDYGSEPVIPFADVTDSYPEAMAFLSSTIDLTPRTTWYLALRYVDSVGNSANDVAVDSYLELDTRLAYRCDNGMEIAVVGRNLLDEKHQEFFSEPGRTEFTEVERTVQAVLSWEY